MVKVLSVWLLLFILLCIFSPCSAASPPLILHSSTESAPLTGHLDFLEDKNGNLQIAEVAAPETNRLFRPDREVVTSAGYKRGVYWARFTISTEAPAAKQLLLELTMPNVRNIDFYLPTDRSGFDCMQAGTQRPMSIRKFQHRNPVFPLVIDGASKTFYLRVDGVIRATLPLTAWSQEAFSHMDSRRALIAGCYFGAMLVMFAYNFFIFLSLRDKSYLFYILEIFFFALYVFYNTGFLLEFVTGEMPALNSYAFMLCVPSMLTGLAFGRNFLETKRTAPLIDRLMVIYMLVVVLCIPLLFVVPAGGMVRLMTVILPISSLISLSAGAVCLHRGFRPARYFIGARVFRILAVLSFTLAVNNILPWNLLTSYALQIGSTFEVLLLSFALADRINIMRREKEEAQADALRSSHLAALGELAAGVAHEINTPVNTIINSADLLLEDVDRQDLEHDVEVIKNQGRRIATIAGSLLFFAHRPAHDKVPFAVGELLQETLNMFGARLRKESITVNIQVSPELMNVMVHPQQIEQVYLNILSNALHALDERHGSNCDCKTLEIVASEIVVNNRPFVRVAFLDNGIGIPANLLGSVKDSFVTTKKAGRGTGLGLSISQQIILKHGGDLTLESRVGEYTRVCVDLPGVIV